MCFPNHPTQPPVSSLTKKVVLVSRDCPFPRMQKGSGNGSPHDREDWEVQWEKGMSSGRILGTPQKIWFLKVLTSSISKDNLFFICNPTVTWKFQIITQWSFYSDILKVPIILVPIFSFLNFY